MAKWILFVTMYFRLKQFGIIQQDSDRSKECSFLAMGREQRFPALF